MIQSVLVTLIVLLCAAYWLQKMAPATLMPFWRALASVLRTTHVLPRLRARAEQLAMPPLPRTGCGSCRNCDGSKGGGCH
ncbi:hypothetical protein OQ252_00040 [Acetobacter farinalis]|uniref:Uncharacterized protein n=1 Tax=Acetobacter farinalis TaxID=1260984 RepID=A0ABT3Q3C5_9PROT|nr:DUF6587 family protein [Acetobacter farinalis]MCX2559791.1 hypothetical protein [Acetobacter farinalis]NHO28452.1 hypothetical protein [Acetobacter farinalis]